MKSDLDLQFVPRWFTGAQWADGTAQREFRKEYEDALFQKDPDALSPRRQMQAQMRLAGFKA